LYPTTPTALSSATKIENEKYIRINPAIKYNIFATICYPL